MKLGVVQLDSREDVGENLRQAEAFVEDAAGRGAELVALPEMLHLRVGSGQAGRLLTSAEPIPGPITDRFAALAKRLGVHVLLGSIAEQVGDPGRYANTSVLIDDRGAVAACYRKVHLFDAAVDAVNADRELDRCVPGDAIVTAQTPLGRVGMTVCYDLRFPELYRSLALAGARLVFVPADFTNATGEAHWLTLLRARAIENGLFIVAPAQCGRPPGRYEAYGHSAVVSPWGEVVFEAGQSTGVHVVEIDPAQVDRVRKALPVLGHLRPDVYGPGAISE